MSPRTGRPPSENPKERGYRLRMTDEELEQLAFCSEVLQISKAEVIRQGIGKMYEEAINRQKK